MNKSHIPSLPKNNPYLELLGEEFNIKKTTAVIDATFAVTKGKPKKKILARTGFEPLTSAIPVQPGLTD